MKCLTIYTYPLGAFTVLGVEMVKEDGVGKELHMYADLVRPAGLRHYFDQ